MDDRNTKSTVPETTRIVELRCDNLHLLARLLVNEKGVVVSVKCHRDKQVVEKQVKESQSD